MSKIYFVFRLSNIIIIIIIILFVIHRNTHGISTVMINRLTPVCSESHTKTLNNSLDTMQKYLMLNNGDTSNKYCDLKINFLKR